MPRAIVILQTDAIGRYFCALLLSFLLTCSGASAASLTLSIADVASSDFTARGIKLELPQDGSASLRVDALHIRQRDLRGVQIHCAKFALSTASMSCQEGRLERMPGMAVEFDYRFSDGSWRVSAQLRGVPGKGVADWIPADAPRPSTGTLNGKVSASGDALGVAALHADIRLDKAGFSDAEGLHAAEGLDGTLKFDAARKGGKLDWQGAVDWRKGELFWQPLYLRGGYRLSASGSFDGIRLRVAQAVADLPEIGRVQMSALWDDEKKILQEATLRGANLELGGLFSEYAKPFLEKGTLAESSLYGQADVDWHYHDGATRSLRLILREAGIADAEQRFALLGVNTGIDWHPDEARSAEITFAGGALLGAPLGAGRWTVEMRGMEFAVAQAALPVFDGRLELNGFKLYRVGEIWHWQSGMTLSGISMEQLSEAAGWPKMLGTLNGNIPQVSYTGNEVKADGELKFQIFDGTVVASGLRLSDPFGRAPRLFAGINMRGLDLDLLTRTFSFGNMQGRIDVDVNKLELQNWVPARFDARLASSEGSYPKKISQKAVQNISALGGSGAVSALQRSYLSIFENFGYDRIEWHCVLRNGVCAMSGIGEGSGPYVIVRGGGIPAITVMGYNRSVSWDELLKRIKRVTQGNMQAVVK